MHGDKETISTSREDLISLLREAVSTTPPQKTFVVTADQMESVVSKGITSAFTQIGITTKDPIEMQKDFAFIRKVRRSSDQLRTQGMIAAVGIIVTAIFALLVAGAKAYFGSSK